MNDRQFLQGLEYAVAAFSGYKRHAMTVDDPNDATWATLHWDFFGPQAEPTAKHFLVHLDEFLAREQLEGCTTGVASERPGHCAAFCRCPPEHEATLIRSLKPRRRT